MSRYNAKSSMGISFDEWESLAEDFESLDIQEPIGKSLEKTAAKTTARYQQALNSKSGYPAHYQYASGLTASSMQKPELIEESFTSQYVRWGLDAKAHGGFYAVPFYLMYGTDKMSKMRGLSSKLYSQQILNEFCDDLEENVSSYISKEF
jgi:hypothetical protein